MNQYQEHIESFELETGSGGDFEFYIDGALVYSKRETGEHPSMPTLVQSVYDAVNARSAG